MEQSLQFFTLLPFTALTRSFSKICKSTVIIVVHLWLRRVDADMPGYAMHPHQTTHRAARLAEQVLAVAAAIEGPDYDVPDIDNCHFYLSHFSCERNQSDTKRAN